MINTILNPRYILVSSLVALIAGGTTAMAAELVFPEQTKNFDLEANEHSQTIPFKFTNEGSKTIKIVGMKPSCGCTVANLEKKEYAPGESGTVSIEYKRVANTEKTSNTVLVVTDEEKDNFYTLAITANQKDGVALSTRLLDWTVGGSDEPQTVEVTVQEGLSFNITGVRTTHDSFEGRLTTIEPKKKYKITVQPTTTEYPGIGAIRILNF